MHAAVFRPWLLALSCSAIVGCETQTQTPTQAPSRAQTASLQCGAGGAVAGYLVCKALGRPDSECVKASAVIGIGGAAICYNYAANLERRRAELAGHENDLDHRIRYVRGLNQDSEQLNAELDRRLAATTRSTDELVAQIQRKQVTQAQLARERQARDHEVEAARAQVAAGDQALKEVKAYRAQRSTPSPDLDVAIARQEQLLANAQRQVQLLAAQRARVT